MLVDTHAHINQRPFSNDLPEVLQHARSAGVTQWVAPATDLESCQELQSLCQEHDGLLFAPGVHPCDAHTVAGDAWVNDIRQFACDASAAAVGEIGLDYFHKSPDGFEPESWKAHQAHVLRLQLDLAVELGLNVIIHTRDSHDDMVAQIQPYTGKLRAVFHCFTGTEAQAQEVIALGHLVSFTGIVTFKNSPMIQAVAQALPSGTFMLETDSPHLAPVPHRGKRCEPAFVADTARFVAALRGVSLEGLAAETTATARGFFRGL